MSDGGEVGQTRLITFFTIATQTNFSFVEASCAQRLSHLSNPGEHRMKTTPLARPVKEFYDELFTRSVQRKLKLQGLLPKTILIPGTYAELITADEERKYIERLAEISQAEADAMRERRRAQTVKAGKASIASPHHPQAASIRKNAHGS
jgi:hypothetical protein